MENRLKKLEERTGELEARIKTLEAFLGHQREAQNKEHDRRARIARDVEEMRRDPEAWKKKHGRRGRK